MAFRPREVQPSGAMIVHPILTSAGSAIRRAILPGPGRLSAPPARSVPALRSIRAGKRFPPVRTAL